MAPNALFHRHGTDRAPVSPHRPGTTLPVPAVSGKAGLAHKDLGRLYPRRITAPAPLLIASHHGSQLLLTREIHEHTDEHHHRTAQRQAEDLYRAHNTEDEERQGQDTSQPGCYLRRTYQAQSRCQEGAKHAPTFHGKCRDEVE